MESFTATTFLSPFVTMAQRATLLTLVLALTVSLMPGAYVQAQNTATLSGTIQDQDTGETLPGANVVLENGRSYGVSAESDGTYQITNVQPGTYTLRVSFVGYRAEERTLAVEAGASYTEDFALQAQVLRGEQVTVSVGSRASRRAAGDLAVPVDAFSAEELNAAGSPEMSVMLQQVSPSINFPRQTVSDGMDALRPFTLRGLSPDHTLVLINGKRRHRSALVNRLGSGVQKGSSTVDLNAIPSSVIGSVEILRDGAAAQYGSDAIAGVMNLQLNEEPVPFRLSGEYGGHVTDDFDNDGTTYTLSSSYGLSLGDTGYINVFGELRFRDPTTRAGADPRDQITEGDADEVADRTGNGVQEVVTKNNPIDQPNHQWGNGESDNYYLWANGALPVGSAEIYAFGGYSYRDGFGKGFYRRALDGRNWPTIYPQGFLPTFDSKIADHSVVAGLRGDVAGWNYDVSGQTGGNNYEYNIINSLNVTLGPGSDRTDFYAGTVSSRESVGQLDLTREVDAGLAGPLNVAVGALLRYDQYEVEAGEEASWVDGPVKENQNGGRAAPGSQVFPGFRPSDAVDESRTNVGVYADLEADVFDPLLVNVAGRFENYSDFGSTLTGKIAMRYQPQEAIIFRGSASTGFRAPNLAQRYFSRISTTFIDNEPFEVGLFDNDSDVARALGVPDLEEEKSYSLSGGVTVNPNSKLSVSTDLFYTEIDDRVILSGNIGGDALVDLLENEGIFNVQRAQIFSNAVDTRTWGLDLTANYTTPVGDEGVLYLRGAYNFTRNEVFSGVRTPSALGQEFGESIFDREARLELERERPESTAKASVEYERSGFTALLRGTRHGETLVPDTAPEDDFTLSAKVTVDAEVGYRFAEDRLKLSVGARNLTDVYPDLTPDSQNFGGIFPYSTASPFGFNGRYVYSKLSFTL